MKPTTSASAAVSTDRTTGSIIARACASRPARTSAWAALQVLVPTAK